jgi:hypothetical protein
MSQYSVLTHCHLSPLAVKHGFSWPSFLFGPLWALCAGCWRGLGLYAIIIIAHVAALPYWTSYPLNEDPVHLAFVGHLASLVALSAWLSTFMNGWLRQSLLGRGYVEADVVVAMDPQHAIGIASLLRPFPAVQGHGVDILRASASPQ